MADPENHRIIPTEEVELPFWKKYGFWARFVVCLGGVIFLSVNSITTFAIVNEDITCIVDKVQNATTAINEFFKENVVFRNVLMIIVSLMLDFSIFIMSYCWIIYGKNWRPILTVFMFYVLKIICQNLMFMKYPETMIWEYPGFPSFAVSYYKTADFFYCGQIGLFLIIAIELWHFDFKVFSIIAYVGIVFHFFMMIVLRGHYFIDLFSGLVAAHYFHILSEHFHPYLNKIYNLDKEESENQKKAEEHIIEKDEKSENLNKSEMSTEALNKL